MKPVFHPDIEDVAPADVFGALADPIRLGILVAPGTFYGPAGEGWVRLALSATDERIDSAVRRLTSSHLRW